MTPTSDNSGQQDHISNSAAGQRVDAALAVGRQRRQAASVDWQEWSEPARSCCYTRPDAPHWGSCAVVDGVVHRCPLGDSGVMPCCGRTPFDVPLTDRMTLRRDAVTCGGSVD